MIRLALCLKGKTNCGLRACFYSWQSRFERATRSLATFVRLHRSLRSLAPQRSATLGSLRSLAPFMGLLTDFAHSLVGWLKFLNLCSRCNRVLRKQTCSLSSLETRPYLYSESRRAIGEKKMSSFFPCNFRVCLSEKCFVNISKLPRVQRRRQKEGVSYTLTNFFSFHIHDSNMNLFFSNSISSGREPVVTELNSSS